MDTPQPATKSIWRTPNHYLYLEPGTGYTLPSTPIGRDAGDYDALFLTSIWTPLSPQENRFGVHQTTTYTSNQVPDIPYRLLL
jgi:hypothetical protein